MTGPRLSAAHDASALGFGKICIARNDGLSNPGTLDNSDLVNLQSLDESKLPIEVDYTNRNEPNQTRARKVPLGSE